MITAQLKCNLKWYFISMWSQNIVFKKLWMLFKYQNTFRILLLSIVYSFASHILFITSKGIMEMTNDKYKQRKTIKWSTNNYLMLHFSKPLKMLKDIEIYKRIRLCSFVVDIIIKDVWKWGWQKQTKVQNKMDNKS